MAIEYIKRRILTSKVISEKNKYVFEVDNLLTKSQIKQSLLELFNLNPQSIVSINTHRPPQKKNKKTAYLIGNKNPFKRAIITLKEGQTLSFDEPIK